MTYLPILRVVHSKFQQSTLSADYPGPVDFRGMLNLFVLLVVTLNMRLVVENILKYGWLIPMNPLPLVSQGVREDYLSVYMFFVFLLLFPTSTYLVERFIAPRMRSRKFPIILHGIIIGLVLYCPYRAVRDTRDFCGGSIPLLIASCVYTMKIISYVQVCGDLYRLRENPGMEIPREVQTAVTKYPRCLNLKQWYEFVIFPTLNFQLSYPRTLKIHKRRIFRHLAELLFCSSLIAILAEQYVKPLLMNAHKDLRKSLNEGHFGVLATVVIERWLKLTVPSLYLWLLGFFALFHCWLNILAEITRFADRRFYDDWWNAISFRDYWQKWNLPVHKWILRHLYAPLRAAGYSQTFTGTVVFGLSGIIHEYIILLPLHIPLNGVIASAFISQIPLIALTETEFVKSRPVLGNCLFWFTNCFTGQPAAILIFFILAAEAAVVSPL